MTSRVRAHRRGLALGDLLAVVEDRDVLGDAHDHLHVVLDEQDRQLALVAQPAHELGEPLGLLRVHAGGRLVEQQQLRVRRERAGDLHAALVAVGEVDRELVVARGLSPTYSSISRGLLADLALLAARARRADDRADQARASCASAGRPSRSPAALIVANRRMFWNVRAMPSAVILSGRTPSICLPSNSILPSDGRYRPVSMLKNVVLPAPLGPMIETMDRSRHGEGHVVDGDEAAEDLRDVRGLQQDRACRLRRARGGLSGHVAHAIESPAPMPSSSSSLRLRSGNRPCGPQDHHQDDQEPEDAEVQLGQVEVQPEVARDRVEHVGDEVVVDEREQDRPEHHAPDRAQAAEDDHRQDEDREAELERLGVDRTAGRSPGTRRTCRRTRRPSRRPSAWS